jgi:hypothetical protein
LHRILAYKSREIDCTHRDQGSVVHRVRKFVEIESGRIGYAMTAADLSKASNGASWEPDPSFSVADAILDNPDFASILAAVLKEGHVIVAAP